MPALKSFRGVMLDVGNEDGLMDGNKVGARFISHVLPFFGQHLDAQ